MAFRATNQVPVQAYAEAKALAVRMRSRMITHIAAAQAGFDAAYLMSVLTESYQYRQRFQQLATTDGIVAYAQAQEDDPTYNVATEFTAMLGVLDNLTDWLMAAIPADSNDYVLLYKLGVNAVLAPRAFTIAQLAPLVPYLEAVRDSVS